MANWSDIIPQSHTLNEGLVGYYKCNDRPSGTTPAQDVTDSIDGQDLTFFNQTQNREYNQGIGSGLNGGDALVFHNTSDVGGSSSLTDAQYARSLFQNGLLDFGPASPYFGKPMSISMWVKLLDKKRSTNLLYKRGDGTFVPANTTQYYSFFDPAGAVSEDNFVFRKGGTGGLVDAEAYTGHIDPGGDPRGQSYPIVPGAWYHVVMLYDRLGKFKPHQAGGSVYIIVNSRDAGSGAPGWDRIADARNFEEEGWMGGPCAQPTSQPSSNMENSNTEVWLGPFDTSSHGGNFAHVVIDKIGVWSKILGSGEIKALFNDGFGQDLPYINVAVSGSHKIGGITSSRTPTGITPSGYIGGYAYAAQQFGPSGTPNGILPRFGGLMWAPRQWPVVNPNDGEPPVSEELEAVMDTSRLKSFWAFDNASGTLRTDVLNRSHLFPYAYKTRFEGDKSSLNTNISGFWPLEQYRLRRRVDVVGPNHLVEVNPTFKVATLPGSLSGVRCAAGDLFVRRSSPRGLSINNDFTVAGWFRFEPFTVTDTHGIISKFTTVGNQREWGIFRQNSTNTWVQTRGRPNFVISPDGLGGATNRIVAASGTNNTAPRIQANRSYFIAARLNRSNGEMDITWASGAIHGGTWENRIFNRSKSDALLTGSLFKGTAPFDVGNITFTTNQILRGSVANVGVWDRFLTDDELELLWGSGVGQQIPYAVSGIDYATGLYSKDPLGPGRNTTIKKLGVGAASFAAAGGAGAGAGEAFALEHGRGAAPFSFNGSSSFNFAGWVRFTSNSNQIVLSKSHESNGLRSYILRFVNTDNKLHWRASANGGTTFVDIALSSSALSTNTWYFVSCGYDAVAKRIFGSINNGAEVNASLATINVTPAPFMFGTGHDTASVLSPFTGYADAWGLWGVKLTSTDLTTLYNSGNGVEITQALYDSTYDRFFEGYDKPGNKIGGYLFSKPRADARNNNFFGGYTVAPGVDRRDTFFGGYLFALPLTTKPKEYIGGMASGLRNAGPAKIGGWVFGSPENRDYIEQHSRTLVKVRSKDVVDQNLNLDAQMVLFQKDTKDFNAKLSTFTLGSADFNAKLNVEYTKLLPSSVLTVNSSTDVNDVTQVIVTASGILNEGGTSFTNAYIDFCEPYGYGGIYGNGGAGNPLPNTSISGFTASQITAGNNVVSGVHNYNYPGKYIIVASFTDNLGQVTSSAFALNTIVSGSIASVTGVPVEGVDYPAIDISGLPRFGVVPPGLLVDFDMRASGISTGPVGKAVTKLNAASPISNSNLSWNFANGISSTVKQPISTYNNPGRYIVISRYQFIHPSGAGSSPNYSPKPINIADSLIIGFNR